MKVRMKEGNIHPASHTSIAPNLGLRYFTVYARLKYEVAFRNISDSRDVLLAAIKVAKM